MVLLQGVGKAFGRHQVLGEVNLAVPAHSMFGLLGGKGEGKSTLLRLITGLLRPDRGSIALLGMDLQAERHAILRQTGVLIDAPSHYPNLTGAEMLRIGCTAKRLAHSEIARVLDLVNLGGSANRLVKKYSLGMKQRLALAHALLGSPRLLILDEPTACLDPDGVRDVRALLRSLPAVAGVTLLVASSSVSEIEQMASHVALLRGGRIRVEAPIGDLLAQQAGHLAIEVGDAQRAWQLLQTAAYLVERTGTGQVRVAGIERHQSDRVNALLVHGGIRVYQSVYHTPSLEQWFQETHHAV